MCVRERRDRRRERCEESTVCVCVCVCVRVCVCVCVCVCMCVCFGRQMDVSVTVDESACIGTSHCRAVILCADASSRYVLWLSDEDSYLHGVIDAASCTVNLVHSH